MIERHFFDTILKMSFIIIMNSGRQFCLKNARLCVQSFKKTLPASHVSRSNEGTLTKFAATSNPLFTPNYHRDRRSVKIKIVAKDAIATNGNGNKEKN